MLIREIVKYPSLVCIYMHVNTLEPGCGTASIGVRTAIDNELVTTRAKSGGRSLVPITQYRTLASAPDTRRQPGTALIRRIVTTHDNHRLLLVGLSYPGLTREGSEWTEPPSELAQKASTWFRGFSSIL